MHGYGAPQPSHGYGNPSYAHNNPPPQSNYPSLYTPSAPALSADDASVLPPNWTPSQETAFPLLQFSITPAQAEEKHREWVKSLHFTPTGFVKAAVAPKFKRMLVPFLQGSVSFTATCEGSIERHLQNQVTMQETCVFDPFRDTHSDTHSNMFFCSDMNPEIRAICEKMEKNWIISDKTVSYNALNVLRATGDFVGESETAEKVWERVFPQIRQRELEVLTRQYHEQRKIVKNLRISTINFTQSSMRIIYLPIYYGTFSVNPNEVHRFVVNGQNGTCFGERPSYGLGKMGDVYKGAVNLLSTITHSNQSEAPTLMNGKKLALKDEFNVYNENGYYLTFPRSDYWLLKESTGTIGLYNNGDFPIEIRSQKRRGAHRGPVYEMKPKERSGFDFKGHWVIEVMRGNPNDLFIEHVSTSGGNNGDRLGMCS
eukprot:TRINITY_DN5665_c0_g1_i1.p1 TRINITY_DN5665_c0_g1~~TRINITY_DN5665_c0_g1_i1.p1  ORF type:complete len:427 (+),score=114.54 TRINITY_DN5665_c0_g1_i1:98-1378(+)